MSQDKITLEIKGNTEENPWRRNVVIYEGGMKERFIKNGVRVLCSWPECYRLGRYWLRPCHHCLCLLHGFKQLDAMTFGLGLPYEAVAVCFTLLKE